MGNSMPNPIHYPLDPSITLPSLRHCHPIVRPFTDRGPSRKRSDHTRHPGAPSPRCAAILSATHTHGLPACQPAWALITLESRLSGNPIAAYTAHHPYLLHCRDGETACQETQARLLLLQPSRLAKPPATSQSPAGPTVRLQLDLSRSRCLLLKLWTASTGSSMRLTS